jgi:hypothetical protein
MKKKSLSKSSLEELLKNKKDLKTTMISLGILFVLVLVIMLVISKYNLLTIFFPLVIAVTIPIYSSMEELNSEIKRRNSRNS